MKLSVRCFTTNQKLIWDMKSKGFSEARIAKEFGVARQTIHKTLKVAHSKVYAALQEEAKINKIKIMTIDPAKGFLVGYSPHFKTKALITFSVRNGVQVWYKHEGDCESCDQLQVCREVLMAEAKDRNIQLPENADSIKPSKLAEILFEKITGG